VNFDVDPKGEDATTDSVIHYLKNLKPQFTFVHLDHVDHAGHEYGHKTPKYYQSVEKADSLIGKILAGIEAAGMMEKTVVLICSDHGGIGYGHGGETPAEVEIPFILYGKNVKKGYEIPETVYQYDNAATVAFMMGLKTPQAWIGRPVKCAFDGFEASDYLFPFPEYFSAPLILPKKSHDEWAGGFWIGQDTVAVIQNPNTVGEIRYTLDGSDPDLASALYEKPIPIQSSTLLRAAVFKDGLMKSPIETAHYRLLLPNAMPKVQARLYYGEKFEMVPDFDTLQMANESILFEINVTANDLLKSRKDHSAIQFVANLHIPVDGDYEFFTRSDDGSILKIDDRMVVNNDGDHGVKEQSGMMRLTAGIHRLEVGWFNGGGGYYLDVQVKGPGVPKQILHGDWFK